MRASGPPFKGLWKSLDPLPNSLTNHPCMEKGRDLLLGALIELRKWVPQVRGPHEQVFVRGVEVSVFSDLGKHESQERTVKVQQENGCPIQAPLGWESTTLMTAL
jgi:hypothetical protein